MRKANALLLIGLSLTMLVLVMSTSPSISTRGKPSHAGKGKDKAPNVTITNPTNGATVSGSVTITATAIDKIDGTLIPDIYIDGTFVTTANSYDWDTTTVADGSHTISAEATDSGSKTGSDSITVTVQNNVPPPPPPGGNRYALCVGVNIYKESDVNPPLDNCNNDANDWYYHLTAMDYSVEILGDQESSYVRYDGLATEAKIKERISYYLSIADADDIFVFTFSGHGWYDKWTTKQHCICPWDDWGGVDGEDGTIWDTEFADLFAPAACKWFIFFDACNSGGMDEVMQNSNAANGYMTTTCGPNGYGYDVPEYSNGAWNYHFLEISWQGYYNSEPTVGMEDVFAYAMLDYPYHGPSTPMEFDGDPSTPFTLN
jgi:hypothetical protein